MSAQLTRSARARLKRALERAEAALPQRVRSLVQRLGNREILLVASSLAFYGVVSALPLLMLSFAAVEAVAGDDALERFADLAADTGPEGTGEFLEPLISGGGRLTLVTVLFTLWPATVYGGGLRRALMRWSSQSDLVPGLRGRIMGLGLVLLLPALLLAGLPLMFTLSTLAGNGAASVILGWLAALVAGAVFGTVLASLLYRAFTPDTLSWKDTATGAALAATTTAVFSMLFVIYLSIGNTEERFGGGATAVVVLIGLWLFIANILLLSGYQTVMELAVEREERQA